MKKTLFLCVGSVVSFWMASCAGTNREVSAEPQQIGDSQEENASSESQEVADANTEWTKRMRAWSFRLVGPAQLHTTLESLQTAQGSSGITRIFAWDVWCAPCHEIAPLVEQKYDTLKMPKNGEAYAMFLSAEGVTEKALARHGYRLRSYNLPMLLVFRGATLEKEIHGSDDIKEYINGL